MKAYLNRCKRQNIDPRPAHACLIADEGSKWIFLMALKFIYGIEVNNIDRRTKNKMTSQINLQSPWAMCNYEPKVYPGLALPPIGPAALARHSCRV